MCAGHPSLVHLRGALGLLLVNLFRPSVHVRWAPLACTPEGCPGTFVVESIRSLPSMCAGHPSLVHLRGALGLLLVNLFRPSVHVRWAHLACTPKGCPGAFFVESIPALPSMSAGHPSLVHLRGALRLLLLNLFAPFRPCALGTPRLYT
eukprot:scaffold16336_cov42-Phaeocystis_antarctica.AAC.2